MTDRDEDGYGASIPMDEALGGTDCDDTNADTFMGAAQIEGLALCMRDVDDDGYGDPLPPLVSQQVQTVTMIKQISRLQKRFRWLLNLPRRLR